MASRVTVTSTAKAIADQYARQAKRGPAQLGYLMGAAVESASQAILDKAIYTSPKAIPQADAYVRMKGRKIVGRYSKSRVVSRSGTTRASFIRMASASVEAASYSVGSRNMELTVKRLGDTTYSVWRSIDGGKTASLENKSWSGRQQIIGQPSYLWPIVSGRPRRFINKRWSQVLRVIRRSFEDWAILQGTRAPRLPRKPRTPSV